MKIRWFFTEIWRYKGVYRFSKQRPSAMLKLFSYFFYIISYHIYLIDTTVRQHTAYQISCQSAGEDIAIWIFRIFGLKCLFRPTKWVFGGHWTPKCDYSSSIPPNGTSSCKSASFKLSTVKIRWGVWPVGELTESVTDTQTDIVTYTVKFIFCPCIALDRQ